MPRIIQKLVLAALLAMFSTQANAMFIQPDWWDPNQPGVGTNRYMYSHGDPINKMDPSGHDTIWQNSNGSWSSSDGSTYDPTEPTNNSYDFGSDQYGYLNGLGLSPAEQPGYQPSSQTPNLPSSGRSFVLTESSRDFNNADNTVSKHTLYTPSSVFDSGINSFQQQELERQVYNEAGGPGYVAPRMLAVGAGSVTVPIAMSTAPAMAASAMQPWVRVGASYSKAGQFKTYAVRWGSNAYHARKKFSNPTIQNIVQRVRMLRLPGTNWRVSDPGHLHLWKR